MRHLWSLLAGVVVAPLTWCLVALGQSGSQEKIGDWVNTRRFDTVDLIEPAVYLVVAGILLGLIATLRISPLGPLVGGLLLVAAYVGMFISPLNVRKAIPDTWEVYDRHLPLRVPLDNGTLLLIGVLLLMAVFSTSRWRGWPATATVVTADGPGAPADPAASDLPVTGTVIPPARSPEREPVSVGAESTATDAGTEKSATRTQPPTQTPWSAPPGQSRPDKS
jgi:hypothetical protein